MVTIRRVMAADSSEPTVTITMREQQNEKLLYKVVNGKGECCVESYLILV